MNALITILVLAPLLSSGSEDVTEFFPMAPGTSWVYLDEGPTGRYQTTDTALATEEIAGTLCTPIATTFEGKEADRAYYAVKGGEIHIVAFDKRDPLTSSYAILKDPATVGKWTHAGETFMYGAPADMSLKGKVTKGKSENFDGRSVETLVVTLEVKILEKFGTPITSVQTAVYGRGIGLIKNDSVVKLKKRTERSSRRLLSFHQKP